ncbi:MAG TPA: RsmE family RNA methyltransferase [Tepidisphaeraceae bacterium]|nr:RsmE family RNA methyltransferase [Tepidisphaeraceae bacterium]
MQPRRFHVPEVRAGGTVDLDPAQARHAREVLRLRAGDEVELFDAAGTTASAVLEHVGPDRVSARVGAVREVAARRLKLVVAAAVPKANRADWMVEKLSEVGTDEMIPLATARSVVLPEGKNKRDRWHRLAAEAAKQSRRPGLMTVTELRDVADVVASLAGPGWCLSTAPGAVRAAELVHKLEVDRPLTLFIGPEGGWTDAELAAFSTAGVAHVSLTHTVLRVETAALAAAAVVLSAHG